MIEADGVWYKDGHGLHIDMRIDMRSYIYTHIPTRSLSPPNFCLSLFVCQTSFYVASSLREVTTASQGDLGGWLPTQ